MSKPDDVAKDERTSNAERRTLKGRKNTMNNVDTTGRSRWPNGRRTITGSLRAFRSCSA